MHTRSIRVSNEKRWKPLGYVRYVLMHKASVQILLLQPIATIARQVDIISWCSAVCLTDDLEW